MKGKICNISLEIHQSQFDARKLSLRVVANGILIKKSEWFYEGNDFEDQFSYLVERAKRGILEQVKKLDAIDWDKNKILEMAKDG